MSTPEASPSSVEVSSQSLIEIAGGLQAVYNSLPDRDFVPDIQQDEAIFSAANALLSGKAKGHFEMATGTGKTLIKSVIAEAAVRAGKRVLMLGPTLAIADQLYGESGETGLGRFTGIVASGQARRHYGTRRANSKAPVVVSTYAGLLQEAENPKLGKFDVILADECHRALGEKTAKFLSEYMPGAVRWGFSATPDYAEDRKAEEIFGERLFEFSLRTAVESGKIAPIRALLYETGKRLRLKDRHPNFTEAELSPLINEMDRNGVAVRLARDLVADGRQGIIACIPGEQNSHARLMAGILSRTEANGRRIVAADIGSHLPIHEQKRILKEYKEGKIDILTFTRTLEEGWDSDRASFCINLAPSTSPVRIKQLLGRIMRRKADGRESIFVDFIDKKFGLTKNQYTALHALEVEDIDVHRVLGRSHGTGAGRPKTEPKDLSEVFEPDLLEQLSKSQGLLLHDVLITALENPQDPLIAAWNRTLEREKPPLPEELPYNPVVSVAMARRLGEVVRALLRENGIEPTPEEVYAAYSPAFELSRYYGVRIPLEDVILDPSDDDEQYGEENAIAIRVSDYATSPDSIDDPEGHAVYMALRTAVVEELKTLSEREAGVIRLRYSLNDDVPRTLDEIGIVYGVVREVIRRVENDALSKLRAPTRSDVLRSFLFDDKAKEDPGDAKRVKKGTGIFDDIKVPVYDPRDSRDYNVRLQEACQNWLVEKQTSPDSSLSPEKAHAYIRDQIRPDFIQLHGKPIRSVEEARAHYAEAVRMLTNLTERTRKYRLSTSLQNLIDAGTVSNYEIRLAYGLHGDEVVDPQSISRDDFRKAVMESTARNGMRESGLRSQTWWRSSDTKIPFAYKKQQLLRQATTSMQEQLAKERSALLAAKKRIEDRHYPEAALANQQASLMVVDTKLAYLDERVQSIREFVATVATDSEFVLL